MKLSPALVPPMFGAFVGTILAAVISACTALGIPQAQTFNERTAVALSSVTAVRQSTLTLLQAKRLNPDDAENVNRQADTARQGIDVARSIVKADTKGADAKLAQAAAVLTALDAYLKTKGKTP